jgi:hypothetical protein
VTVQDAAAASVDLQVVDAKLNLAPVTEEELGTATVSGTPPVLVRVALANPRDPSGVPAKTGAESTAVAALPIPTNGMVFVSKPLPTLSSPDRTPAERGSIRTRTVQEDEPASELPQSLVCEKFDSFAPR